MKKIVSCICLLFLLNTSIIFANSEDYQTQIDSLQELLLTAKGDEEILINLELTTILTYSMDLATAEKHILMALEKSKESTNELLKGRAKFLYANWHRLSGDCKKGNILAKEALADFQKIDAKLWEGKVLHELIFCCYETHQTIQAEEYFALCEPIFQELNALGDLGKLYLTMGTVYYNEDPDKAMEHYFKAWDIFKQTEDEDDLGNVYLNIGNIYGRRGQPDSATIFSLKALEIYEPKEMWWETVHVYYSLAVISEGERSEEYALKALKIARENKFYNIIGWVCTVLAEQEKDKGNMEASFQYSEEGVKAFEEIGSPMGLILLKSNLADFYVQTNEYRKARQILIENVAMSEETQYPLGLLTSYLNFGHLYLKWGRYPLAKEYLEKGLPIALQLQDTKAEEKIYRFLSETAEKQKDYKAAFQYLSQFKILEDSLQNVEKTKQVEELQVKYETEKKEHAIVQLEQDNILATKENEILKWKGIGAAILIFLLGIIAFFWIRQRQLKATQKATNLEQKLLRFQMNPHFIFNALTAIQSFLYEGNLKEAGYYLVRFSKLIRMILEHSRKEFIPLKEEITFLEYYLEIQQMRFDNSFDFKIHLDENIKLQNCAVPPMLAQPFIENAVEHGKVYQKENGRVDIRFSLIANDQIEMQVEDNGIGRKKALEMKQKQIIKKHNSLATLITEERLAIFNKGQEKVSITDLVGQQTGTLVSFLVPFQNNRQLA